MGYLFLCFKTSLAKPLHRAVELLALFLMGYPKFW
jgi:hypothetical protein